MRIIEKWACLTCGVLMFAMAFLSAFLEDDADEHVLPWIWMGLLAFMAAFSCLGFVGCAKIPYGRYRDQRSLFSTLRLNTCKVPARLAWMVQEIPSVVVPLYLILNVGGRYVGAFNPNIVLLGMFLLHYANRTFLYAALTRGKTTPLPPVAFGFCICAVNGYLQGRYLTHYARYDLSWFTDPRFMVGHLVFLLGMAINIHSDSVLRSLRAPGETTYRIPRGGMFEYVSCANYTGEILEWIGYAIACWSAVAAQFSLWTFLFLGSRATQHHRFYQEKFEDYPKSRKAFIPFVL